MEKRKCSSCGHFEYLPDDKELGVRCLSVRSCVNLSEWKPKETLGDTITSLTNIYKNFAQFIIEKNRRYGDSALHPLKIFSKIEPHNNICSRLDEKLQRISNADKLKKNDVSDVFGYIALLMAEKGWTTFEEMLD
jgi:hypothetical protein